ncbi:MAG: methionyl-tRNA formyltransferase [Butyrivibrio sp.]|nr:methionyl-tRNA formyltransferase [Butyrivibrio sp.]
MKVVFMGTPDFAVNTLAAIIEAGHEVAAVVTQPDKARGRSGELKMPPVKELAVEHNLKVYQPVKIKDSDMEEVLREINPDVIVVVAFGQILPKSILELPKYGCVNVHASLLPKYRGAAPIQWAVIDGEEYSGVTTMQMDVGVDTGDMLMVEKYKLAEDETGGSLFERLAVLGAKLLVKTLDGLEKGTIIPVKQGEGATHAAKLDKQTGLIDFSKSAVEIERLIRGLNPWPSAYTGLNGKTIKIWKASVDKDGKAGAGEIYSVDKNSFSVGTAEGGLVISEVQLEGKKRMSVHDFLLGTNIETGTILG